MLLWAVGGLFVEPRGYYLPSEVIETYLFQEGWAINLHDFKRFRPLATLSCHRHEAVIHERMELRTSRPPSPHGLKMWPLRYQDPEGQSSSVLGLIARWSARKASQILPTL